MAETRDHALSLLRNVKLSVDTALLDFLFVVGLLSPAGKVSSIVEISIWLLLADSLFSKQQFALRESHSFFFVFFRTFFERNVDSVINLNIKSNETGLCDYERIFFTIFICYSEPCLLKAQINIRLKNRDLADLRDLLLSLLSQHGRAILLFALFCLLLRK